MVQKQKPTADKSTHTDEKGSDHHRRQPATDRPCPPEPFEECGPSGGYGGAGTEDDVKDVD
jgi:hypothetical protein